MAGAHHAREVRLAGRDKTFGLWLFPTKDIKRQCEFVQKTVGNLKEASWLNRK
jgi:hypothetical protein